MKKLMLTLAAAMMVFTAATAQKMDKAEMAKKHTEAMAKKYNLTEKQQKKLLELNKKYADQPGVFGMPPQGGPKQGQGNFGNNRKDQQRPPKGDWNKDNDRQKVDGQTGATNQQRPKMDDSRRQEMEKAQKAYKNKLKSILSSDQMKQYENDQNSRRGFGGRNNKEHR